jgi:hypothetical protein
VSVFLLLVGVLLLGLAAYDAAMTTISTTAAGGPVTSRLSRWWCGGRSRNARGAIDQLLDRVHVSASHPALPLDLQPLRAAGLPVVDDGSFAEQLERLAERRGRLATFAAESKWERSPTS